ncbi:hypothetical protein HK104_000046 [Borealophlyctis nickersoniae]|nr:hypothetical protein HK104_000046 [Borealophlyctis nickersoniae]
MSLNAGHLYLSVRSPDHATDNKNAALVAFDQHVMQLLTGLPAMVARIQKPFVEKGHIAIEPEHQQLLSEIFGTFFADIAQSADNMGCAKRAGSFDLKDGQLEAHLQTLPQLIAAQSRYAEGVQCLRAAVGDLLKSVNRNTTNGVQDEVRQPAQIR